MTVPARTEVNPVQFENQALFFIEGRLSELQIARTTVNLLEQIDSNIKSKSAVAGAAAALSGMYGIVANSASIAFYEGEDTYNFAALLDDQVVCGSFQHADQIKSGDPVRAVVSRRGDVLFVHSIMNAQTQEFYMPLNIVYTNSDGLFRHCMRVAIRFTILLWLVFAAGFYFTGIFSFPNLSGKEKAALALMGLLGPPIFMFSFEYWTYRSMRSDSLSSDSYGSAIFRTFGFPNPEKIDLTRDTRLSTDTGSRWYAAWRGDKLLKSLKA